MVRFRLLALALAVAAAGAAGAAEPPVHLFILSGQSNMARLDPEKGFLPEARALLPGATIVPLKGAVGGVPIRFWLAEWDAIARDAGLAQKNEKGPIYHRQILAEFEKLKAQHGAFASVTFCWMQGERDAKSGLEGVHERALTQLIANLRRDLRRPDLNVVIGRLSDHNPGEKFQAAWELVRAVQKKTAQADPRGAWVDTDDLNDLTKAGVMTNDLHYTSEGYVVFGQRLARQSARLIRGEKPAANGRPEGISP